MFTPNSKNKNGFTLAEVLITLTIIGVIAALTIPNLMQRYQEHTTVNKVKKFYSTLTNAYTQAVKEYGTADEWGIGTSDWNTNTQNGEMIYNYLFKPYFKIAKNCGKNNNGNCITNDAYKLLNGSLVSGSYGNLTNYYKILLSDGSSVIIRPNYQNENLNRQFEIFFDVNGIKQPNTVGKDLFVFFAYYDKIIPYGEPQTSRVIGDNTNFDNACAKSSSNGARCAAWLIYKGNMDYLHCDDLTWNGKNKCSK